MYYGTDKRLAQTIQPFFEIRKKDFGEIHTLTQIDQDKKLDEALVALSFDILIFEQSFLPTLPTEFLSSFKKKWPGIKAHFLLAGDDTDPVKIMKQLEGGYSDYIVFPPDRPLLVEKLAFYTMGSRSSDTRQVYSLQLSQQADLAKPGYIEELSEFDCKVRSFQKPEVGELIVLYSRAFTAEMTEKSSVLARCYGTAEHPGFKEQFLSQYYFVGITPDILTNIRNALRKTYINKKQR